MNNFFIMDNFFVKRSILALDDGGEKQLARLEVRRV